MKRETGLRNTALLTGALVAAGVTGTVALGAAAYASDQHAKAGRKAPAVPQAPAGRAGSPPGPTGTTPGRKRAEPTPSISSGGTASKSDATSGGS